MGPLTQLTLLRFFCREGRTGGAADWRSAAAEAMADGRLAEMNAAAKGRKEHKWGRLDGGSAE
jgi:hypothetical protein